jgi:polyhydroxybutyrate depolymerase
MYHHDFHHGRTFLTRRLVAWIFLAFSLLLVIGAAIYSLQAGLLPGLSKNGPLHILPNFGQGNNGAPCSLAHTPGDETIPLSSGGLRRTFIVHLPPSYTSHPLPIVITYHGYDNTAANMEHYTNMGAEADQEQFIVVFPQGALDTAAPPKPSWNAGLGAFGPTGTADDVQFTRDMLAYLLKNYCTDARRVYVTGYSIGASMAYRVACELSDQIAALATVEGAFYHIPPGGCQAHRPLPVLEIHGQADLFAPYDGAPPKLSVQTFLNLWLAIDQCDTGISQTIFQQSDVTATRWPRCANGVIIEHYRISDGGHVWPGSAVPMPTLGYTTHTISANVVIWHFFSPFKS